MRRGPIYDEQARQALDGIEVVTVHESGAVLTLDVETGDAVLCIRLNDRLYVMTPDYCVGLISAIEEAVGELVKLRRESGR